MTRAAMLFVAATLAACHGDTPAPAESAPPATTEAQAEAPPYVRAARLADSAPERALDALRAALAADARVVQRALLDPVFARSGLRDDPEFRAAVHEAAVSHAVSDLTLAPPDEPGEWLTVEARVVGPDGRPVPGAEVRVFATDAEGLYHPTIDDGERTARLFGTLVADAAGSLRFRTVYPGPYPGTRNPRHVHVNARYEDLRLAVPHYAVFDDDPLLELPENAEPRGEAVRISVRRVDGERHGTLDLPLR